MKISRAQSIACMVGGYMLMVSLLTWHPESMGLGVTPPCAEASSRSGISPAHRRAEERPQGRFNSSALPYPGNSMLAYDELLVVVGLAKRIERMILAAEAPLAEMCPQGLRDPDGRLGLYIVCAQPLVEPVRRPGMNDA